MMIELPFVEVLEKRLLEPDPLIQFVVGPRQVGKTTGIKMLLEKSNLAWHYASADDSLSAAETFVDEHWQNAVLASDDTLLVIDEIQKVPDWSEKIKRLWDEQKREGKTRIRCLFAGSSALRLKQGLTESLAGRFEQIPVFHWNYRESSAAWDLSFDDYLRFGGYPGAYRFIRDFHRWYSYVKNAIIDMVIGQDIIGLRSVRNPALFKQAFELLCHFPAQEVSYNKLLGQLQDKGNTDLVKHYIDLYEAAYLFKTLFKYSPRAVSKRKSSPKILPLCPALFTLTQGPQVLDSPLNRGRLFELVVGSDLARMPGDLYYFRQGNLEVDYVYEFAGRLYAIEVKSGRRKSQKALAAFREQHPNAIPLIITPENYHDVTENLERTLDRLG